MWLGRSCGGIDHGAELPEVDREVKNSGEPLIQHHSELSLADRMFLSLLMMGLRRQHAVESGSDVNKVQGEPDN